MSRFFLFLVALISLAWIMYATYDHTKQRTQFRPEYLFGSDDKAVLIIQNAQQASVLLAQFASEDTTLINLLQGLNWNSVHRLYVSKTRGHVLIETTDIVTPETIKNLFIEPMHMNLSRMGHLSLGNMQGRYAKNRIYFHASIHATNKGSWGNIQFDRNSDAVMLNFLEDHWTTTDIYIKKSGIIEYRSQEKEAFSGIKVNDQEVFAQIVPQKTERYTFYEADYLRTFDKELLKSPLNNWMKYGLVHVVFDGHQALISDCIETIDVQDVLFDFYETPFAENSDHLHVKNTQLSDLLASDSGLFVYPINEFVVISADSSVCEAIIADYKLGHTLAHDRYKTQDFYENLPQKVNFRIISPTEKQTLSLYQRTHLYTKVIRQPHTMSSEKITDNRAVSYRVGGTIREFFPFDEHLFVITQQHKIVFFNHTNKVWEHQLNESIVGSGSIIDIYANGKQQLLVATKQHVYLFDTNGKQVQGFPIQLSDHKNALSPVFYRWKGNGFFVLTAESGQLIICDQQGRELAFIRSEIQHITHQPIVWVSANQPFIGVYNNEQFDMIHAETHKQHRIFSVTNVQEVIKEPNEIKLVRMHKGLLSLTNQKGQLAWNHQLSNGQLIPTLSPQLGIVIRRDKQLLLINTHGISWATINLPFSDIADVQLFSTDGGLTLIATVDAIENKVYLWKANGELFGKPLDGSSLVRYDQGNLYTIIDNLIVRYAL